jgi:hypothetical protein
MDKEIDKNTDIGKKKSMIIESNETSYTELILLIDIKTSSNKVDLNIIKGCKTMDYPDCNDSIS